jgi:hypothetical protein
MSPRTGLTFYNYERPVKIIERYKYFYRVFGQWKECLKEDYLQIKNRGGITKAVLL